MIKFIFYFLFFKINLRKDVKIVSKRVGSFGYREGVRYLSKKKSRTKDFFIIIEFYIKVFPSRHKEYSFTVSFL
jgi:hypothetical protein